MNELIERAVAAGVGVGQISDAMDELGLAQNAGGGYRIFGGKGGTAFGRAFTVRQALLEPGRQGVVRQGEAALTLAAPGDILIVDARGRIDVVTWGEGHSLRGQVNGLAGVVIYGATRDSEALQNSELPVLCLGTSPLRSKGRLHTVEVGGRVDLAGVSIDTGQLVAMSSDGIVAIPLGEEARVLTKGLQILEVERQRDQDLRGKL